MAVQHKLKIPPLSRERYTVATLAEPITALPLAWQVIYFELLSRGLFAATETRRVKPSKPITGNYFLDTAREI
jgi:hypothetical protein